MATIAVAIGSCLVRPIRRRWSKKGPCFTANNLIIDFLNGTVLVPFALMIGSAFSQGILEEALKTNRLFLTVGGVIGLIFVVREFINGEQSQHNEATVTEVLPKVATTSSKAANSVQRSKQKQKQARRR